MAEKDKIIERQAKVIAKQAKAIDALKKKNRELAFTVRDMKAAMGRYEKSVKSLAREHARTKKALAVALRRLNVVDSAHSPTSK